MSENAGLFERFDKATRQMAGLRDSCEAIARARDDGADGPSQTWFEAATETLADACQVSEEILLELEGPLRSLRRDKCRRECKNVPKMGMKIVPPSRVAMW